MSRCGRIHFGALGLPYKLWDESKNQLLRQKRTRLPGCHFAFVTINFLKPFYLVSDIGLSSSDFLSVCPAYSASDIVLH